MNEKPELFFEKQLGDLAEQPFHALIISAKSETTRRMAANWLVMRLNSSITEVETAGQSIKIEQIRFLYTATSHRQSGQPQAVVIHNAELMTESAQNALLKLLEEPPAGVHFLLMCSAVELLLPTIRSRCVSRELHGLNKSEFADWFRDTKSAKDIERLFLLSGGDPIMAETEGLDQGSAVQAKQLMGALLFEALSRLNKDNPARIEALNLVKGMTLIAERSIKLAKTKEETLRWVAFAQLCLSSQQQLNRQANTKLILARLLLGLRRSPIM